MEFWWKVCSKYVSIHLTVPVVMFIHLYLSFHPSYSFLSIINFHGGKSQTFGLIENYQPACLSFYLSIFKNQYVYPSVSFYPFVYFLSSIVPLSRSLAASFRPWTTLTAKRIWSRPNIVVKWSVWPCLKMVPFSNKSIWTFWNMDLISSPY